MILAIVCKFSFRICFSLIFYNIKRARSSHENCSLKKVFFKMSQNSLENTGARVSFLIKLLNKRVTLPLVFPVKFETFLRPPFL